MWTIAKLCKYYKYLKTEELEGDGGLPNMTSSSLTTFVAGGTFKPWFFRKQFCAKMSFSDKNTLYLNNQNLFSYLTLYLPLRCNNLSSVYLVFPFICAIFCNYSIVKLSTFPRSAMNSCIWLWISDAFHQTGCLLSPCVLHRPLVSEFNAHKYLYP